MINELPMVRFNFLSNLWVDFGIRAGKKHIINIKQYVYQSLLVPLVEPVQASQFTACVQPAKMDSNITWKIPQSAAEFASYINIYDWNVILAFVLAPWLYIYYLFVSI